MPVCPSRFDLKQCAEETLTAIFTQHFSSTGVVNIYYLLPGPGLFCAQEDCTSPSQTRKNVQKAKIHKLNPANTFMTCIYVGKVKDRADFLDYFGN